MANRRLNQFRLSYEPQVVEIYAVIDIGATGEPTISRAKGVTSITRNSAGNYTLLLNDAFNGVLHVGVSQLLESGALDAPICKIESADLSSAAQTVVLQFYAIDNSTATDPDDGAQLMIHIAARNSSI